MAAVFVLILILEFDFANNCFAVCISKLFKARLLVKPIMTIAAIVAMMPKIIIQDFCS